MPVHQFLPSLAPDDAIGNHVLRMQRVLRQFGPSDIYVAGVHPSLRRIVKPYRTFDPAKRSTLIYHASIGSPMAHHLLRLDLAVVIDYHNVTPMYFFAGYEPRIAAQLYAGRVECGLFARKSPMGLADSDYSARDLDSMGFSKTAIIPILIDFSRYREAPDAMTIRRLRDSKKGTDILFVGRISPNKRQEDLIKTLWVYKRLFDPAARLFLVGPASSSRYLDTLHAFIRRLELKDVVFTGAVPFSQLLAHYAAADIFVSMSEHEGFCVPPLEAMSLDLPVIAFAAGAVPGTLGGGGVLFKEKRYEEVAALLAQVARDRELRERLVRAGRERLEHFRPEPHEARLAGLLSSVVT